MTDLRPLLGVLVCATLTAGCSSGASPSVVTSTAPAGSVTASPTTSAAAAASSTPDPAIPTLTDEEALDAGTYRIDLDRVAGGKYPSVLITVPDGWNHGGWLVNRPRSGHDVAPISIQFWDVQMVYGHPCQWEGTAVMVGPTVDQLAEALADVPVRNATAPTDVTVGGYSGKYLEWSVPADQEFDAEGNAVGCDSSGELTDFLSWTGKGMASTRYHQGPGQIDRVWILDVESTRLVIDAFYMPYATAEERQELTEVVESIRFEP